MNGGGGHQPKYPSSHQDDLKENANNKPISLGVIFFLYPA